MRKSISLIQFPEIQDTPVSSLKKDKIINVKKQCILYVRRFQKLLRK